MLTQIGTDGQRRLLESSALIVGLGGLGCPVALYLTGAGVGRIGLADADRVSLHNLQRQMLYSEADVDRPKVDVARDMLRQRNMSTSFEVYPDGLTSENARDIIAKYDLVVDCTDNFAVRFLINDVCAELGRPWIMGAIAEFSGLVSVFPADATSRLEAVFPDRDELVVRPAARGGVIGATPGVVGSIEAAEAVKMLAGMPPALAGRLFQIDLLTMQTSLFDF